MFKNVIYISSRMNCISFNQKERKKEKKDSKQLTKHSTAQAGVACTSSIKRQGGKMEQYSQVSKHNG